MPLRSARWRSTASATSRMPIRPGARNVMAQCCATAAAAVGVAREREGRVREREDESLWHRPRPFAMRAVTVMARAGAAGADLDAELGNCPDRRPAWSRRSGGGCMGVPCHAALRDEPGRLSAMRVMPPIRESCTVVLPTESCATSSQSSAPPKVGIRGAAKTTCSRCLQPLGMATSFAYSGPASERLAAARGVPCRGTAERAGTACGDKSRRDRLGASPRP